MQTIHHYIRPVGSKGRTLDAAGRTATQADPFTLGLRSELLIHFRPEGRAIDADPPGVEDAKSWRFAISTDWNPSTPPCFVSASAERVGPGLFRVDVSGTRTCEMILALVNCRSAPVSCELAGVASGGTWADPVFLCQYAASIDNRLDSGVEPTPFPPTPVPSDDAIARIRAALAEISAERPITANQTADRVAAVVAALQNL